MATIREIMTRMRLGHRLYQLSFVAFLILAALSLVVTAFDIIEQTLLNSSGANRSVYMFITCGAYLLLALFSAFIAVSRVWTVQRRVKDIPKRYVPIKSEDLPMSVHAMISEKLQDAQANRLATLPQTALPLPGLSTPASSDIPNIQYLKTIMSIPHIIKAQAEALHYGLTRAKSQTFRDYLGFLAVTQALDSTAPLTDEIIATYERLRFDAHEAISEQEFRYLMRLVTLVIADLRVPPGWQDHSPTTIPPQPYARSFRTLTPTTTNTTITTLTDTSSLISTDTVMLHR